MSRSPRKRYEQALNRLETLEPRTLMSATITPYAVANVGDSGAYDANGNLWVLNFNSTSSSGYSLDEISASHTVINSEPISNATFAPLTVVAGANGIFYATDSSGTPGFGSIDAIDTVNHTVTTIFNGTSAADQPQSLTVTGSGAVWFTGFDQASGTSVIGRLAPTTYSPSEFTSGSSLSDSYASALAPSGTDSVWVGFTSTPVNDGTPPNGFSMGHNHIVTASFNGSSVQVDNTYDVNTGDPVASQNNFISSIVDGGGGSVWFTLANNNLSQAPQGAPDQIVQLDTTTSSQTAYPVPGGSDTTQLGVGNLTFDANNNLWFSESNGAQFGFLGTSGFTMTDSPTTDPQTQMVANPAGNQLSILTSGADPVVGYNIVQIDLPAPTITFNFTLVNSVNVLQGTNISNTLLATFVAPTPTTGYSATITWGDTTTSTVTPQYLGSDTWAIVAPSKSFATQGTYVGSIVVKDGSTAVGGTPLTSTIADIPLNVTSFTVSPVILRIVTAVGTFTDDPGLALSTWTATINWGDNTSSKGIIVRDPTQAGRYFVLAVHQYRTKGTYTARLTVTTTEQNAAILNATLTSTVTAR